jgi:hypothetical protein
VAQALVVAVGAFGIVATSEGFGVDVVGTSVAFDLVLDAGQTEARVGATAFLEADLPVLAGSGQLAVTVEFDETASGAVDVTLRSSTSGNSRTVPVFDVQSQGTLRVAMDAFASCPAGCSEDLELVLTRTGGDDGRIRVTATFDGFASLDAPEGAGAVGTLQIDVDR